MLNAKRNSESKLFSPGSDINLIGKGTVIKGDIQSYGDIRIDGKIKGLLSTNAKVVVGPGGEIEGDIVCQNADIMGKVTGTIKVEELLFLKADSIVNGDIYTSQFEMEPTAKFNGRCQMEAIDQEMLEPKENASSNKQAKQTTT
jgi:cytoskeletal protein CcmA (bactofilin family)